MYADYVISSGGSGEPVDDFFNGWSGDPQLEGANFFGGKESDSTM